MAATRAVAAEPWRVPNALVKIGAERQGSSAAKEANQERGSERSMKRKIVGALLLVGCCLAGGRGQAQEPPVDRVRDLETQAIDSKQAAWGYWGTDPHSYANYQSHSNRLIPVYTFGIDLHAVRGPTSPYRNPAAIRGLYGRVPPGTLNPQAEYFDQTQVYSLQLQAAAAGKKYIFLVVFDGMDWWDTLAAATVRLGKPAYTEGRGTGLHFLDYRGVATDYGFCVTSPRADRCTLDPDAQTVRLTDDRSGGYDARLGGATPWAPEPVPEYLIGGFAPQPDLVTDSASSATSLCSGIKTFNAAINVDGEGRHVEPIARQLQRQFGWAVGVVTSVPISHATPACAYGNNVTRDDYQDLSRDLLGLPSVSHRSEPLPGVDVLLGCGWGQSAETDPDQGRNFVPGNRYLTADEQRAIERSSGGRYRIVTRTADVAGGPALLAAADQAAAEGSRLFGFFGTTHGHLPYRTADGNYEPAKGFKYHEVYSPADLDENPKLADMTAAALRVLQNDPEGFWLMVEAGDVDWAKHDDNIDCAIGAIFSGDDAVRAITDWIEARGVWEQSALIVTSDHGHYFHLVDPAALVPATPPKTAEQ